MAPLCRMGWTQYLELSGLERSIDWDSPCSSRGRDQQPLLPAVFINITPDPPAAADHNDFLLWVMQGKRTASVKRELDGSSREPGTEFIAYRWPSPMKIGMKLTKWARWMNQGAERSGWHSQWVHPSAYQSQFSHSEYVSDGIGDVTSYFQFRMDCTWTPKRDRISGLRPISWFSPLLSSWVYSAMIWLILSACLL